MRLPRVRFTVRRMMVAVAIVAFAAGSWTECVRRSRRFRRRADFYGPQVPMMMMEMGPLTPERLARHSRDYYISTMWIKYEFAARYPFLPLAPDPPEPE